MRKRLMTLKVDDADREQWQRKAQEAGIGLSKWIREQCNEAQNRSHNADAVVSSSRARTSTRHRDERRGVAEEVPGGKSSKTCAHGTAKGYRCWQCGGIAVMA